MTSEAEKALLESFVEYQHYHRTKSPYATEADAESAARKLLARVKRDAKAEALREAAFHAADISKDGTGGNDWFPEVWAGQVSGYLEARATKHETGDRA